MKDIQVNKDYILEGTLIKKDSKISVLEESDNFDNLLMDYEGNQFTKEEFEEICQPIMDALDYDGLLSTGDVSQIKKDVIDYCMVCFNRTYDIPSVDLVKNYLRNRNQSFTNN